MPLRRLFEFPTIAQLVPIVVDLKENPKEETYLTSPSLVPLHVVAGGENLFCFHAVKGGVGDFKTLIGLLPEVSLYGLQSEGFLRSIRHTTIESMAAYYVEIIRSVQKKGPYSLIGFSSGGVLAFEAARILSRMGEKMALVLLLDPMVPGTLQQNPTDLELINMLAEGKLDGNQEELSRLEGDERLAYAFDQLKKSGDVPSNYGLDIARNMLAVVKNNLTAEIMYTPEPYGGHIVFIAAETRRMENLELWKKYISGSLEIVRVAAEHKDLLTEPFVRETVKQLQRYMGEAQKMFAQSAT
jgi:thioesterase domain-containing protein